MRTYHIHSIPEISALSLNLIVTLPVFCQPTGAADRCLDCSVERDCPYSARKIYVDRVKQVQHMISTNDLLLLTTRE